MFSVLFYHKLFQAKLFSIFSQDMKFNTGLQFLVTSEALRAMHIRAGAVVVDRTSENNDDVIYSTNVADAAASDAKPVSLLSADSGGLSSPTDINDDDDDGIASFNPFDVKYNPPQQHRKLSKKTGGPSDPPIPVPSPLDVSHGGIEGAYMYTCLLYTSPSPRDPVSSRMPSSA